MKPFSFCIAIALLIIGCVAVGAAAEVVYPTPPPAWPLDLPSSGVLPSSGTNAVDQAAMDMVAILAARHPNIALALALIGALRLLIKPVVASIHALADASGSPKHQEFVVRVERSPTFKTLLFLLDWLASIKVRR